MKHAKGILCSLLFLLATVQNTNAYDYKTYLGFGAITLAYAHILRPLVKKLFSSDEGKERKRFNKLVHEIEQNTSNNQELPEDPDELEKHRHDLRHQISILKQARKHEQNNPDQLGHIDELLNSVETREKEAHETLQKHTDDEAEHTYREELQILRKRRGNISDKDMLRIVQEKHGDKPFMCKEYKEELHQKIQRFKRRGANPKIIELLERLEQNSNRILSKKMEDERAKDETALRDKQLFDTEIGNRQAIKDYYQEAQRQVVTSRELMESAHQKMKEAAEEIERSNRENIERSETVRAFCIHAIQQTQESTTKLQDQHQQLEYHIQETQNRVQQENDRTRAEIRQEHRKTRQHVDHVADMVDAQFGPRPPAQNPEIEDHTPSAPPLDEYEPSAPPMDDN